MTYRGLIFVRWNAEVTGSRPLYTTNRIKYLRQTAVLLVFVFGIFWRQVDVQARGSQSMVRARSHLGNGISRSYAALK